MEQQARKLMKYLTQDAQNPHILHFDEQQATQDQQSVELIESGKEVVKISQAFANAIGKSDSNMSVTAGIPIYGNWCGPGHGGGDPIDTLDSLCQAHDYCYQENGYFFCACDRQLMEDIKRCEPLMKQKERMAALAIYTYYKFAPCNED